MSTIKLEPTNISVEVGRGWVEGLVCTVMYDILLETEEGPQFLGSNKVTMPSDELKGLSSVFAEVKDNLNKIISPSNDDNDNEYDKDIAIDDEDPL